MATGYTHDIKNGITFEQFALSCARNFGACIEMRDDPSDKPIPKKFKVDSYHVKELKEAKTKLKNIKKLSLSKCEKLAQKEFKEEANRLNEMIEDSTSLQAKYKEMLEKVTNYVPPTPDHVGLKEFMVSQIKQSMEFDCDVTYYKKQLDEVKLLKGEEFKAKEIVNYSRDIAYHQEQFRKEKERVERNNKWISKLRESLK